MGDFSFAAMVGDGTSLPFASQPWARLLCGCENRFDEDDDVEEAD